MCFREDECGRRQEDLHEGLRAVPHGGRRGQAQAGSQPLRSVGTQDRAGCRLLLHRRQHRQGHHLGGRDHGHLSHQPQEVHPRHKDGLRRPEKEEGQGRPDSLHQGHLHSLDRPYPRSLEIDLCASDCAIFRDDVWLLAAFCILPTLQTVFKIN